jgi:hypothetical protein
MNNTSQELDSNDFTIDVGTAIEVLGVTQPRLSQLTTRGSLSAMRKKVGGRNRLFYNKNELVQYVQSSGMNVDLSNLMFANTLNEARNVALASETLSTNTGKTRSLLEKSNFKLDKKQTRNVNSGILNLSAKTISQKKQTEIQVLETLKNLQSASKLNLKNDETLKLEIDRINGKHSKSLIDMNNNKISLKQLESKIYLLEYQVRNLLSAGETNATECKKSKLKTKWKRCCKLKASVRRRISL